MVMFSSYVRMTTNSDSRFRVSWAAVVVTVSCRLEAMLELELGFGLDVNLQTEPCKVRVRFGIVISFEARTRNSTPCSTRSRL